MQFLGDASKHYLSVPYHINECKEKLKKFIDFFEFLFWSYDAIYTADGMLVEDA